jgi:hypothetical protein
VRFDFGDVDGVSRPFVLFRLAQDRAQTISRALVDTGSAHTVMPASYAPLFEGMHAQRHISELGLGGYTDRRVPEYEADISIVCAGGSEAVSASCPVLLSSVDLPFPIVGDPTLRHMVLVVRASEGVLHVQSRERFADSPHRSDPSF